LPEVAAARIVRADKRELSGRARVEALANKLRGLLQGAFTLRRDLIGFADGTQDARAQGFNEV
jgi:hypothetical protein